MSQAMTKRPNAGPNVDHVTGLPLDIFPGNYGPKERAMIAAVCERYGFDPLGKEVEILHGQIFITAKGIARVAANDPSFDGIEIEVLHQDWDRGFFVVKAKVWKKGCAHPIEDIADSDGSKMRGGNRFRHTITRAKARAMRTAFAIPFCSLEEIDEDENEGAANIRVDVRPRSVEERPLLPAGLPPGETVRHHQAWQGHPTVEVPAAHRGRAWTPDERMAALEAAAQAGRDEERKQELRRLHAIGKECGFSHEELRSLLAVDSLSQVSPEDLAAWSVRLSEWENTEIERARSLLAADSLESLKSAWESIKNGQRAELFACKERRKAEFRSGGGAQ